MMDVPRKRALSILMAELCFWMPFWVVPWAVRLVTVQRLDPSEPWVSLFMSLLLPYVAARLGRFNTAFRVLVLVPLTLGSVFCTGLAVTHFGPPSPNLILMAFDSNPTESREFLSHFLHPSDWLVLATTLIPCVAFCLQLRHDLFWRPQPGFFKWLGLAFVIQMAAHGGFAALFDPKESNLGIGTNGLSKIYPITWYPPIKPYVQAVQAWRIRQEIAETISNPQVITGIQELKPAANPRTYVVIIGESMARSHMSLYGYPRRTTPKLDDLRERGELLAFEDVVSSQAQTGAALMDAFTWKSSTHSRPNTVIDFFNTAGFQTCWLSNQPGLGVFDNLAALLTHRARVHQWLRHPQIPKSEENKAVEVFANSPGAWTLRHDERQRSNFDEDLIPLLTSLLRQPQKDKMIFVHLMGSHAMYRARFPKTAEHFKTPPSAPGRTVAQLQVINEYDNSIRYTDSVLARMIEAVKDIGGEAFVIYFSDHGEEVYDWRDFAAHSNEVPSPLMLEIPFLLWTSQGFRAAHPETTSGFEKLGKRPFSNAKFTPALVDLAGLSHPDIKPEDSVFSNHFKPSTRMALGSDYDAFAREWRPDAAHANGMTLLPPNPDVFATQNQ